MDIRISGGGPAGLFFAILMKQRDPGSRVLVFEKRPRDQTFGFGISFTSDAIEALRAGDPETARRVAARALAWERLDIVHRSLRIGFGGRTYHGLARIALLDELHRRCEELGVELRFEARADFEGADLIVGADGPGSAVRKLGDFGPALAKKPNRHIWYGTRARFAGVTLIYRANEDGLFIAHAYPMDAETSTFVVDCDERTWKRAGFAKRSPDGTRAYLEQVFRRDLSRKKLLSNDSKWIHFQQLRCARWTAGKMALLGDAAHTVHFSSGSGTRLAIEDALMLWQALNGRSVEEGLARYDSVRRPEVDAVQAITEENRRWLAEAAEHLDDGPLDFAVRLLSGGHESEVARLRAEAIVEPLRPRAKRAPPGREALPSPHSGARGRGSGGGERRRRGNQRSK